MQEKEEAFAQLQTYVLVMEEKYAPFLSDTMDVVLAAVASWGSESVREVSSSNPEPVFLYDDGRVRGTC